MTPPSLPQSNPRSRKLPLAALAATAALCGGGQLLSAPPAAAMLNEDPACAGPGGFWIDHVLCPPKTDEKGGGNEGAASPPSDRPSPAPTADPACDESKGVYCVYGRVPTEVKTNVGGGIGGRSAGDADAKHADAGGPRPRAATGTRRGAPSCAQGRVFACKAFECKVDGRIRQAFRKKDCDTEGTSEPDRARLRGMCRIFRQMGALTDEIVEDIDRQAYEELMRSARAEKLVHLTRLRDTLGPIRNWNDREWMARFCVEFLVEEDD